LHKLISRSLLALLVTCIPLAASISSQQKKKVKARVKGIEREYPFKKWRKNRKNLNKELEKVSRKFSVNPNQGLLDFPHKKLKRLEKKIIEVDQYLELIDSTIAKLKTARILKDVFPRGGRVRSREEARARAQIRLTLTQKEKNRLEPFIFLKKDCMKLHTDFYEFQSDWMLNYARKSLFKKVKDEFQKNYFSANTRIYSAVAQRVKKFIRQLPETPKESEKTLKYIQDKIPQPMAHLDKLERALNPDMLYHSVLEKAAEENIRFSFQAEHKIEGLLKSLSEQNLNVVTKRKRRWYLIQSDISSALTRVPEAMANLKRKKERKQEFRKYLSDLTSSSESSFVSDTVFKKVLAKKTKNVKTSEVQSGRKNLDVKVEGFSHDLAKVGKLDLSLETNNGDFDRIYGDSKETQALYVFYAQGGRADNNDLNSFVNEVGLLSFSGEEEFLSYKLPKKWKAEKKVRWKKVKASEEKENYNREFTYVDLVVEAHKEHFKTEAYEYVKKIYVPANMLIIFRPGGAVKRFETFSDVRRLRIKPQDLENGNLYYKFLNYSVDGPEIHLNGIDQVIKLAKSYK